MTLFELTSTRYKAGEIILGNSTDAADKDEELKQQ